MSEENDFGFVVPGQAPGAEEAPKAEKAKQPEAKDPFAELTKRAAKTEAEEAEAEEAYESLEAEFERLASLRRRRDEAKAVASDASADYEAQRWRMGRALEAQGTKQFKSAQGLGSASRSEQYTAKIVDPATFIPWAKSNCPEILTVNSQTLVRFVRENFRDKGVPLDDASFPPGIETGERANVTVTIPKPKKGKD